jgi:hypothetical protein
MNALEQAILRRHPEAIIADRGRGCVYVGMRGQRGVFRIAHARLADGRFALAEPERVATSDLVAEAEMKRKENVMSTSVLRIGQEVAGYDEFEDDFVTPMASTWHPPTKEDPRLIEERRRAIVAFMRQRLLDLTTFNEDDYVTPLPSSWDKPMMRVQGSRSRRRRPPPPQWESRK